MQPYQYPVSEHTRLHGPAGYSDYESFRDWLRDDFLFRCVYCLHREKWGRRRGGWHIDHWHSQVGSPQKVVDYDNLVYSCVACNLAKGRRPVPNPCECLLAGNVEVNELGAIKGLTKEAKRTIRILGLDSPEDTEFRYQLIGIYQLREADYQLFLQWMGYPDNLPDLSKKRCSNSRP